LSENLRVAVEPSRQHMHKEAAVNETAATPSGGHDAATTALLMRVPPVTAEDVPSAASDAAAVVIVMVLSARDHRPQRDAIRATWGQQLLDPQSLYFVIGSASSPSSASLLSRGGGDRATIRMELAQHRDIVECDVPDSYSSLPYKLKFGTHWLVQRHSSLQWIVKVDDDMYVRGAVLRTYLTSLGGSDGTAAAGPAVVGRIVRNRVVQRRGKWAEARELYPKPVYPPWPLGSCGYAFNRALADYIAHGCELEACQPTFNHPPVLTAYQGEDTSLGIWIEQATMFNTTWIRSPFFVNNGKCIPESKNNLAIVVGHRITPAQMRRCYEADVLRGGISWNDFPFVGDRTPYNNSNRSDEDSTKGEAYYAALERQRWNEEAAKRDSEQEERKRRRAEKRLLLPHNIQL
jgi:Galactosyltransferase